MNNINIYPQFKKLRFIFSIICEYTIKIPISANNIVNMFIYIHWIFHRCQPGIFLEKLLRGGKIEIFVSKGGHACVRVHALIVCVPVLIN